MDPPYYQEVLHPFLPRITNINMVNSVAPQRAPTTKATLAKIFKPSKIVRCNNGQIEINQMAVVHGIALHGAYTVRVMAG